MGKLFKLRAEMEPRGDQPKAIRQLVEGIRKGYRFQTLLGVTGSGKTFTIAHVIAEVEKPTLVIAPNKTLAAQLCAEFRHFFPENAVEYFVSYYDYYQPEAYLPEYDLYIEKDASINEEIDRLRHAATQAVLTRRDVIVVASVSCIYGIGSPEEYKENTLVLKVGQVIDREEILRKLVHLQYERNDYELSRGKFRARGDTIEVHLAQEELITRIEMFGDEIERILYIDPITGEIVEERKEVVIYPASHWVTGLSRLERAIKSIEEELEERLAYFRSRGKLVEAQRLEQRTRYDLELLREIGYCPGIENYSRHLDGRRPGEPPWTLLDYFPEDFLMVIDESHLTIPQLRGMYEGDRSRKETLVEYGFRLPSCLDNRPLKWEEFEKYMRQVIFVSATPGPYELSVSQQVVEQIVRPTGLVDPEVEVRPTKGQIDHLIKEIRERVKKNQRVLVTTLTKKMAEDLTEYLLGLGIKVHYLHSDIDALTRVQILRDLRLGKYDVVVGINLLREGLDLPEVSLVAILDADKEGFLRSETSLIQTMGRAARNVDGKVIMYADNITPAMKRAIDETNRRRRIQLEYNKKHGITPQTIQKSIRDILEQEGLTVEERVPFRVPVPVAREERYKEVPLDQLPEVIAELEKEMKEAAKKLEFERAAELRDEIFRLRKILTGEEKPSRLYRSRPARRKR